METQCPQCGAERPPDEEWKQELCPRCLMKLGLSGAIPVMTLPEAEPKAESKPKALPRRRYWRSAAIVATGAAALALAAIVALHSPERPVPAVIRFNVEASEEMQLQDFAVSSDGRAIAYTATTPGNEDRLFVRTFDVLESRVIPDSEGAAMPFWSPDSRNIGFFAAGQLKTVRPDGSTPVPIADAVQPHGGTWSTGGILFASGSRGLQRVSPTGGPVIQVLAPGATDLTAHRWPQFLPDGKHFLFTATKPKIDVVAVGSLDSQETRVLVEGSSGGAYAGEHLFFVSNGLLMRQAFDTRRLERIGEQRTVSHDEAIGSRLNRALPYSVSDDVLAYRAGGTSQEWMLLWMDRRGEVIHAEQESMEQGFALGPGGGYVAVSKRAPESKAADLWLFELERGAATRMTFEARGAVSPLWSPDGQQVLVVSNTEVEPEIRAVSVKQPGVSEVLWRLRGDVVLESWSPDRRSVLFTTTTEGNGRLGVWMLALEHERKPVPFLTGNFNYKQARFSPDNRWVAYVSDESGRDEVYLRPFPEGDARAIVSIDGGTRPAWSRDGRELFYISPKKEMLVVPVEFTAPLRVGRPQALFRIQSGAESYEVSPDGRFLFAVPRDEGQRSPINVILHWSAEQ